VRPAEPPAPTVRFKPQDVFDLIISGSKLAHFMLSEDLRTCGMCGSTDASSNRSRSPRA
jgi:hypothetical protein